MTPEALVAAACPKINALGPAFYFTPETRTVGKDFGLDGFRFYFLGRGGVLGDTSARVVHSAFGYFHPDLVTRLWDSGAEKVAPKTAALAFTEACADHGRSKLASSLDLEEFCTAAQAVVEAADPDGLALFAGILGQPLAADAPARAAQLIAVLREFRGSAHLIAVRAAGLATSTAHFIKRPDDAETFGWPKDSAATVTDADRVKLDAAEAITDALVTPAFAVLDEAGQAALLAGLAAVEAAYAAG